MEHSFQSGKKWLSCSLSTIPSWSHGNCSLETSACLYFGAIKSSCSMLLSTWFSSSISSSISERLTWIQISVKKWLTAPRLHIDTSWFLEHSGLTSPPVSHSLPCLLSRKTQTQVYRLSFSCSVYWKCSESQDYRPLWGNSTWLRSTKYTWRFSWWWLQFLSSSTCSLAFGYL